jgi:hypothetical protein
MGERLMAIVAEGERRRVYLYSNIEHEGAVSSLRADLRVADAREGALNQPVPERLTGTSLFD